MRHLKLFETNGYNQNIYKYKIEFLSKKNYNYVNQNVEKIKLRKEILTHNILIIKLVYSCMRISVSLGSNE